MLVLDSHPNVRTITNEYLTNDNKRRYSSGLVNFALYSLSSIYFYDTSSSHQKLLSPKSSDVS